MGPENFDACEYEIRSHLNFCDQLRAVSFYAEICGGGGGGGGMSHKMDSNFEVKPLFLVDPKKSDL